MCYHNFIYVLINRKRAVKRSRWDTPSPTREQQQWPASNYPVGNTPHSRMGTTLYPSMGNTPHTSIGNAPNPPLGNIPNPPIVNTPHPPMGNSPQYQRPAQSPHNKGVKRPPQPQAGGRGRGKKKKNKKGNAAAK